MSTKQPARANQNAVAPGIALVHTLQGSPVQGVGGVSHSHGSVQPAGLHSTAPYVPPKRRAKDNGKQLCSFEGCKAWPIKAHPYCAGHAKSLGLTKWDNTPKSLRKGNDDDTGRTEATGTPADGDDPG